MRFEELCALEPRLRDLYEEARAIRDDPEESYFCGDEAWTGYGRFAGQGFKRRMWTLVGWYAGTRDLSDRTAEESRTIGETLDEIFDVIAHDLAVARQTVPPVLRSAHAYECVAEAILAAIPPCRNCGCVSIG